MGNYEKSIEYHENALKQIEQSDSTDFRLKAWVLNNYGVTLSEIGDYQKAREKYQQSISCFKKLTTKTAKSKDHFNTLMNYPKLNLLVNGNHDLKFDSVLRFINKANNGFISFNDNYGQIKTKYVLANLYTQRRDFEKAKIYYDSALFMSDFKNNIGQKLEIYRNAYRFNKKAGNDSLALYYFENLNLHKNDYFNQNFDSHLAENESTIKLKE